MEHLHHYTFSNMLSDEISKNCAQILSCFGLRANAVYNLTTFPSLLISFPSLFHNFSATNCRYVSMCVHTSNQPYGYPIFTLFSWQWTHMNPWCNSWHLCCHYMKCWLSCGARIITCVSFKHVQPLSLIGQHCVHQRWHSHPSWCCHYWPNASRFISPILCHSKICCFQCGSNQKKKLLRMTPQWSILRFSNWSIWMLTQIGWYVFKRLCQGHLELEKG
jgi:hypothetical protein